jgi:hypothetical protein
VERFPDALRHSRVGQVLAFSGASSVTIGGRHGCRPNGLSTAKIYSRISNRQGRSAHINRILMFNPAPGLAGRSVLLAGCRDVRFIARGARAERPSPPIVDLGTGRHSPPTPCAAGRGRDQQQCRSRPFVL